MSLFERLNTLFTRLTGWIILLMVLIGSYNAIARHLGRAIGVTLSHNSLIEAQWYLFSVVFWLGAAPALAAGAHVRVDVFSARFSLKTQRVIDLLGHLFLLIPFGLFGLVTSAPMVQNAWKVAEQSNDPGGLARYPIKTLVLIGFGLLVLEGLRQLPLLFHALRHHREPLHD